MGKILQKLYQIVGKTQKKTVNLHEQKKPFNDIFSRSSIVLINKTVAQNDVTMENRFRISTP